MELNGILVFKTDSFDTDSIVKDVLSSGRDAVVLVLGFDRRIRVVHAPGGDAGKTIELSRFGSARLDRTLAPLLFLSDLAAYVRLFTGVCIRHRPRLCWIENTFAAAILGALRKLGVCGEIIYLPGDWLMPEKRGAGLKRYLWGLLFIAADYAACRSASLVLNSTDRITEARRRFWGRSIAKREEVYSFNIEVKAGEARGPGNKICFMGNVRSDSGLEIVVSSLAKMNAEYGVSLKVIGPPGGGDALSRMAAPYGIGPKIEHAGFVEREMLARAVSDCFCGVNILTDPESYSSYTIPGKIIHYLQFLLPVITTRGAGVMADVIAKNRLGVVIEPNEDEFMEAVMEVRERRDEFRGNILEYIKGLPRVDLVRLLEA